MTRKEGTRHTAKEAEEKIYDSKLNKEMQVEKNTKSNTKRNPEMVSVVG
jgi:hypothetical protein